ncbi:hypothetical protein B484DRAFT_337689 [Ochromonadaceae sp. CCMP2298]|nr:hypothetical protein B484DRAFT_337689 [Ochromonadaceae sp. CCMP2298]
MRSEGPRDQIFDPFRLSAEPATGATRKVVTAAAVLAPAFAALLTSESANAAADFSNAVPSALAAYGHTLALVLVTGSLAVERVLIKPAMTDAEEELFSKADAVYGVAALLILATGYLRVTELGKGWDFYSHSPVFWLKLLLFGVLGASSLFPTIKILQRVVGRSKGEPIEPMSEKLAARMTKIINGELLAVGSIPLAASLMARGVGYTEWLPWQAGAAPVALGVFGLTFKYVKEALDWKEGA